MKRLLVSAILCGLALVPAAQGQVGSYLGKDYFKWAAALSHKDASVRRSAAFALGKMGVGAQPAVGKLVKRLETDGDAGVREAAATSSWRSAAAKRAWRSRACCPSSRRA
jgi:hypothetical protein